MFVGTFEHTLDEAGRMVLPATYRDAFADGVGIVSPWDGCLALWVPSAFDAFLEKLGRQIGDGQMPVGLDDELLYDSAEVRAKGQGRLQIPSSLRLDADLGRDVVLAGVKDHIELWNPERFSAHRAQGSQRFAVARSSLRGVK